MFQYVCASERALVRRLVVLWFFGKVLATVPHPRVPPATWAALARSTDSTPNSMPDSMLGTEGQGATTTASPLGVFAKEAVSDET